MIIEIKTVIGTERLLGILKMGLTMSNHCVCGRWELAAFLNAEVELSHLETADFLKSASAPSMTIYVR